LLAPDIKLVKTKDNSKLITGYTDVYRASSYSAYSSFCNFANDGEKNGRNSYPSFGERQEVGFFLNSLGWYQPWRTF
jgi:hypothetical protein